MADVSLLKNKPQASRPITSPQTVGGTPVHHASFGGGGGGGVGDLGDSLTRMAIAIAKLREVQQNNEILRQKRTEEIRKLNQEEMANADKKTEALFSKEVESRFGAAPSPELEPYIAEGRNMTRRGAQTIGTPGDQFGQNNEGVTSRIFEEGGNVINRPASMSDAGVALDRGLQAYRAEGEAGAKRLPPSASADYVLSEARNARVPIQPGGGKLLALGKAASESRKAGAEATKAETEARVAAQTEGEAIRGVRAETRTKEATAQKSEVEAAWEPILKAQESQLKELDANLKNEDLKRKPLEYQKTKQEVEKLRGETAMLQREYERQGDLERLRGSYMDAKTPEQQNQVLRQIAVVAGHEGAVLTDNRQVQQNYISGIEAGQKMLLTAQQHVANKNFDLAAQALQAYNDIQLKTGQLVGSNKVSLMLPKQTEGTVYGTNFNMVPWSGRADVAQSYLGGEVDQAIRGEIPGVSPGYALAIKVAMENQGNPGAMEAAIASSGLPPGEQEIALTQLRALTSTKGKGKKEGTETPGPPKQEKVPEGAMNAAGHVAGEAASAVKEGVKGVLKSIPPTPPGERERVQMRGR